MRGCIYGCVKHNGRASLAETGTGDTSNNKNKKQTEASEWSLAQKRLLFSCL